jgi:hypothetical protein
MMRPTFLLFPLAIATAFPAVSVFSQEPAPAEAAAPHQDDGTITLYRQVMPDGRVVYSDKAVKGVRLDHTITVEPPIKGNLWTTEASEGPAIPPQVERTQIQRVNSIPPVGGRKSLEEANSDVIRTEMLLEDARARQRQLAPETRGRQSRSAPDLARQQNKVAREVADAEEALRQAVAARDALRRSR